MKISLVAGVVILASLAAACSPTGSRTGDGALIGGVAGAAIGGAATRNAGGAVIGGVAGAMTGAIIADATSGRCYQVDQNGVRHRVTCPR